ISGFIDDLRGELPRQILASDPSLSMPETQGKMWTGIFRVGPASPSYGMFAIALPEVLFVQNRTTPTIETVETIIEEELQEEILEIPVQVKVCMHSFRLSYLDLQKIQIGSFIPLPKEWNTRLRILVNEKDAFVGEYGDVEGCHAVMIHKVCKT
ncbi:MAG: FliM/FliN family flagellar motor C-terminal domain-containing protein, partial [Myxococcota bacterium]|nr:FliM/FliN family flagellar motor C-terminal domain-containing protein [Myxococcota bacterium]